MIATCSQCVFWRVVLVFSHKRISSGPEGLQFDDKGMVLPHSILGSLEDFKSYLEVRGEKEVNS